MAGRALQIVPAGARQVAPGVFQMARRGGGRGAAKHHKKKKGPRSHHSLLAQRQIKYAAVLQFAAALQAQQKIQVPSFINFRALVLYIYGVNKRDKGAVSVAKAMQYDTVASSWGVSGMMQMAMSAAMSGSMFGGGGAFGGGLPGPNQYRVTPQSTPDNSGGGANEIVADAGAATDLINAVEGLG